MKLVLLEEGEKLEKEASPGPWIEDDGNIFSRPLTKKRQAIIFRIIDGEKLEHPDRNWGLGQDPMGFVASVGQSQPKIEVKPAKIKKIKDSDEWDAGTGTSHGQGERTLKSFKGGS